MQKKNLERDKRRQDKTRQGMSTVTVKVEFLGGLDQSFDGIKETKITLAKEQGHIDNIVLKDLIDHLASNYITNSKDLDIFIQDGTVRPGILVLINDTDWELEDKDEYVLENGDLISFTSTLHGG